MVTLIVGFLITDGLSSMEERNADMRQALRDLDTQRVELAALVLPGPGKPAAAAARHVFALSYDLWEERFAVTVLDARSQSVSHLALAALMTIAHKPGLPQHAQMPRHRGQRTAAPPMLVLRLRPVIWFAWDFPFV